MFVNESIYSNIKTNEVSNERWNHMIRDYVEWVKIKKNINDKFLSMNVFVYNKFILLVFTYKWVL